MIIILYLAILSKDDISLMEKVLNAEDLKLEDMGFEKRWKSPDSFRLKIVNRILKDPLELFYYGDRWIETEDIHDIYMEAVKSLDLSIKEKKLKKYDFKKTIKTHIGYAEELFQHSLSNLNEAEKDTIISLLPELWNEDSISLIGSIVNRGLDSTMEVDIKRFLKLMEKVNYEDIVTAGYVLLDLVHILITEFKDMEFDGYIEGVGKVCAGKRGDNIYSDEYSIILDPEGNDTYISSGGVSGVSIIIDLEGNDRYMSRTGHGPGLGFLGGSIIWDLRGDDIYNGANFSLGAGLLGVGILYDGDGEDLYRGGFFSQGAGSFGIGILYHKGEGDDIYSIHCTGEGFGGIKGFGILYDEAGDDVYRAGGRYLHKPLLPDQYRSFAQGFGMGWRPWSSGGIGILIDRDGNDKYLSEVYGQGVSYWFSLGMLLDLNGADVYSGAQYMQGAGIHLSTGLLYDEKGNDIYFSRYGPSQGEGHDLSVGALIDGEGDDIYYVSGGQGIGLTNSVGIFYDREGDDVYFSTEKIGRGSATIARGFGGIGIFIDGEGNDFYPEKRNGNNGDIWYNSLTGIGVDIPHYREKEHRYEQLDTLKNIENLPFREKFDSLWNIGIKWGVGENEVRVKWARKKLREMRPEIYRFIFPEKLNTENALVLRCLKEIVKGDTAAVPEIMKAIFSKNDTISFNAIYLAGELKDRAFTDTLIYMLKEKEFEKKIGTIIDALSKIGEKRSIPHICKFYNHRSEIVRIKVATSLRRIKNSTALTTLIKMLKDESYAVRTGAMNSLVEYGEEGIDSLLNLLPHETLLALKTLNYIHSKNKNLKIWDRVSRIIEPYIYSDNIKVSTYARDLFYAIKKEKTPERGELLKLIKD